jgi:hypothetical protein
MNEKSILKRIFSESYEFFNDIALGGKIAQIIAVKNNKIIAFEFIKHATDVSTAIGQCLHYLSNANKVYIVLLSNEKDFISESTFDVLKQNGIGLIISDHETEVILEAREFDKNNLSIIRQIKKTVVKINHNEKDIKGSIIKVLKDYSSGLTISNVAKLTNLNRLTTSKYLAILEAEKIVECKKIGVSKIFRMRKYE